MRKVLMLLLLAAAPALVMPEPATAATAKPSAQEQLLIKKKAEAKKVAEAKKAADAKKAAEAKKAKQKQAAEARKLREKKALEARKASEKKAAEAKKAADKKIAERKKREERIAEARERAKKSQGSTSSVQRAACGNFLKCLLGNPRPGVQRAAVSSASRDFATGEDIDWSDASKYAPGSLIVQTQERALYLVTGEAQARRYKVGVGREGFQWSGTSTIVSKAEWPTWRPPQEMIKREAAKGHMLPDEMAGGPENPLGARALYIGGKIYRIHGTNAPESIGGAVSSGCIRMMNTDVIELYDRVKVGAKVYVYQ